MDAIAAFRNHALNPNHPCQRGSAQTVSYTHLDVYKRQEIDRVYHAVLKDHPELFWVHNREKVYKTTYSGRDYCQFSPGYTYTEEQRQEITQAMENAYQAVSYTHLDSRCSCSNLR